MHMQQASEAEKIVRQYYQAFNQNDRETFFSLLSNDVVHEINQGAREKGKEKFKEFMMTMGHHYAEQVSDLVVMVDAEGKRAAAEFQIEGVYLQTQEGLPEAKGQKYRLPVGAFFEIRNHQITRVTNYYNLQDWVDQVER